MSEVFSSHRVPSTLRLVNLVTISGGSLEIKDFYQVRVYQLIEKNSVPWNHFTVLAC